MSELSPALRQSVRRHLLAASVGLGALVFGIGGWASTTEIAGAVIASGNLVVESAVKKIQHPTGGVVAELRVRDGDRVTAGDVVVRLDETIPQANLAIVNKAIDEALARQARLQAERDGADVVTFPGQLLSRQQDPDLNFLIAGERKLFEIRHAANSVRKRSSRNGSGNRWSRSKVSPSRLRPRRVRLG